MKTKVFAVCLIIMISLTTGSAFSMHLSSGPGLLTIPTEEIIPVGKSEVYFTQVGKKSGVTIGVGVFENIHLAGSMASNGRFFGGIRLNVVKETIQQPAISLGAQDGSVYVVVSKQGPDATARFHTGLTTGSSNPFFFGVEKIINPVLISSGIGEGNSIPLITLFGEYTGGIVNFGSRYDLTPQLSFDIGYGGKGLVLGTKYSVNF